MADSHDNHGLWTETRDLTIEQDSVFTFYFRLLNWMFCNVFESLFLYLVLYVCVACECSVLVVFFGEYFVIVAL